MIKRYIAGGAIAAVAFMAMPSGANAGAAINGTGSTSCTVTGSIKFKPGRTTAGTGTVATSSKTALSACTGTGSGAHVVSGSSSSTSLSDAACPAGGSSSLGTWVQDFTTSIDNTVKWKTDGTVKLNSSVVHYNETDTFVDASTFVVTIKLIGSVTSGSFAGHASTTTLVFDQTGLDILGLCGSKKGWKEVNFTGKNGQSHT